MKSKKKEERSEKDSDQLLAASIQPETAPVEEKTETLYTVGLWKGLKQYRCMWCAFDTLNEETMFKHIEAHRLANRPTPPRKPSVLVADKRGNEVDLTPSPSPAGEGSDEDVFEVELKEIDSTVDKQGNVHKTFTVKE